MRSKYNRTLTGCWNREQIEASIAERQAELDGNEPKSATRIRHLKTKLAKLRAALENGTTVGGNIMPQKRTKVAKSGRDGGVHKRAKTKRRVKLICFKCRLSYVGVSICRPQTGSYPSGLPRRCSRHLLSVWCQRPYFARLQYPG